MTETFFSWFWVTRPKRFLQSLTDLINGLGHYFSLNLMLSTLISPWKRDAVPLTQIPTRFWFQAIVQNLVSRVIGLIVRLTVIFIGVVSVAVALVVGIILIVAWYILPILAIISIIYGVNLLIG